jgi:hypothetical protein
MAKGPHLFQICACMPAGHMPEGASLVDKLKADPVLSKTGSAEAVKVKTEGAGAKAGPIKRGKQKPVPSKTTHVSASQQKQLPTSQSPASKAFHHSDATATIQLSPSAAAALPNKRDCELEITPSTEQQQGEGPRSPVATPTARGGKGKAGKRKASKGARSTPELQVEVKPSNESPAVHTLLAASPQHPDSGQQVSASLGGLAPTEEAIKPEPATQAPTPELTPQKPCLGAQPGAPHAAPESPKSTQPPTAISEQAAESLGSRTSAPVRVPPPLGSGQVASAQGLGISTTVTTWRPATPGTGQPAGRRPVPVRLGASMEQRAGPGATPAGRPPPLEYLMPLVSPKRSSAQVLAHLLSTRDGVFPPHQCSHLVSVGLLMSWYCLDGMSAFWCVVYS